LGRREENKVFFKRTRQKKKTKTKVNARSRVKEIKERKGHQNA
jgi:hypothetical protein